jgi:site-specific DNA recombinase
MTIVGGQGVWKAYGCSTRKEGGPHACSNSLTVRLSIVEARLLDPIKNDLLSDDEVAEVQRRVALALTAKAKSNDGRIAELRAEIANLTDAVATGALRTSKALAERLSAAEAELDRLSIQKAARKVGVVNFPIQFAERYRRIVASLEIELARDVHKARTLLRQLVGNVISLVPHASGRHLVARIGLNTEGLRQAAGGSEIFMVAGAGFEPATFGL